jgi:hypothetical protein
MGVPRSSCPKDPQTLYNLIFLHLKNMTGVSVNIFKADQPTTDGRQIAALNNSLLDQVNYFILYCS